MQVAYVSPNAGRLASLDLGDLPHTFIAVEQSSGRALADLIRLLPDVVILDYPADVLSALVDDVRRCLPRAILAVICASPTSEQLLGFIRQGVADVLANDEGAAIHQFVASLDTRAVPNVPGDTKRARQLAFLSAKGGDGGTLIIANLAATLAPRSSGRVLVLDLSLPFGDAELYLAPENVKHDLLDFVEAGERLDHSLLRAMVHEVAPSLDLIPSPTHTEKIIKLQAKDILGLLRRLGPHYSFILIDLGPAVDHIGVGVVELVDRLFLVTRRNLPSVRRASHLVRMMDALEVPREIISLVVSDHEPATIDVAEFEKAIGQRIEYTLPSAGPKAQTALATGVPVVALAPQSSFAKVLEDWVADLIGNSRKGKSPWRIFARR
jgi:pilus assembly protein CpaE